MKQLITAVLLFGLMLVFSCSSSDSNDDGSSGGTPINTVIIGTQTWMSKNLDVTTYRNGDPIPQVQDATAWAGLTTGAWCYYQNNTANGTTYGKLYNWYAVNDPRGLAPVGWHIPSDSEWTTLTNFLGGLSVAGGKMKAIGTAAAGTGLWVGDNVGATNSSGFSALPGNFREPSGSFPTPGLYCNWWTTKESSSQAYRRAVDTYSAAVYADTWDKKYGFSVRCVKDGSVAIPELSTNSISEITLSTAKSGGNILSDGGSAVTARGIVWSTSPVPNISLSTKTTDGSGVGTFVSNLTGLSPNTTYYVRAYATNTAGTAYGNELNFMTQSLPTATDGDGNTYQTVQIGTQIWMKENLRTTKFSNGESIPNVQGNAAWPTAGSAYAAYSNNISNSSTYGNLYNWSAIMDNRKICPSGWHVPSDAEWTVLESYLGGRDIAGGKMKAVSDLWQSINFGATNESGFSGLPGGIRVTMGFYDKGFAGHFWSSSFGDSSGMSWSRILNYNSESIQRFEDGWTVGKSCRCIKD